MKKLISQNDLTQTPIPDSIKHSVAETLQILDTYYGENRTDAQLGGYVLIIDDSDYIEQLTSILNESVETFIPEFVDIISPNYFKVLYILSSDFSVTVYFSTETAPQIIKEWNIK